MLVPHCFSSSSDYQMVCAVSCYFQIVSLPRQTIKRFVQFHVSSKLFFYLVRQSKGLYSFMLFPNCFSTSSGNQMVGTVSCYFQIVVLYLRAPWKTGESQMGHPRSRKNCLTYLLHVSSKSFLYLVRQSKGLCSFRLIPNCFSISSGNRNVCTDSYFSKL